MSNVTVLRATPVSDGYSHRDVVADADGVFAQRAPTPGQWLRFGERYETPAGEIPQPWTLVCRAGEVTDLVRARQFAVDVEGQNAALVGLVEATRQYLSKALAAGLLGEDVGEILADAASDIDRTLADLEATRGGE